MSTKSARHAQHSEEEEEEEEDEEEIQSKASKTSTTKRKPATSSTKRVPSNNNKSSTTAGVKKCKKAVVVEASEEEAEEEDEQDVVAETQEDEDDDMDPGEMEPAPVKKAAVGSKKAAAAGGGKGKTAGAKKGKAAAREEEVEEGESGTPKEKRLKAKLDATTAALEKTKAALEQLQDLRETRAEASEKALSDIANERYERASLSLSRLLPSPRLNFFPLKPTEARKEIQSYKSEIDTLQSEVASLKRSHTPSKSHSSHPSTTNSTSSSNSKTSTIDQTRLNELEAALAISEAERAHLVKQLEERDNGDRKKLERRDEKWQKELARTVKAKDEEAVKMLGQLQSELATVTTELTAEIQHSKSLQARLKSGSSSSLSAPSISSAPTSSSTAALQKLQEEHADLKSRLMLNEDLSGLTVVSVKSNEEDNSASYCCVFNDCRGKVGALTFKMTFLPDATVSYEPDVDPKRDVLLCELLPEQYMGYMRFNADQATMWFLHLFKALNKIKD
ncbi:hypothetical protein P7C70_g6443, partial [Phenoliferia sp. Uapishka_3]